MMKRNPAHLLLATATIFLIAGLLGSFTKPVDVHLHDSMFIITGKSALIVGAMNLLFFLLAQLLFLINVVVGLFKNART